MRILSVDFGEKRVGLAVSDESGEVVVPVGVVARTSDAQAAEAVWRAAREREVGLLVVGVPGGGDEAHPMARRARSFARRLRELSGLEVSLHGEDLTSDAALSDLREAGLSSRRARQAVDAEAAAVLLRDFLESRSRPRPSGGGVSGELP